MGDARWTWIASGRTFDLRGVYNENPGRRFVRPFMVFLIAGGFFLFASTTLAFLSHRQPLTISAFEDGISLGLAAMGILFVLMLGPGATSITLGPGTVTLQYGERRSRVIDLEHRGSRITIHVYATTAPAWAQHLLIRTFPTNNPLTSDAFESLVEWAKQGGLRLEERLWQAYGATPYRIVTVIGRRSDRA